MPTGSKRGLLEQAKLKHSRNLNKGSALESSYSDLNGMKRMTFGIDARLVNDPPKRSGVSFGLSQSLCSRV